MTTMPAAPAAQLVALSDAVVGTIVDPASAEVTIGRADHGTVVRRPLASRLHARADQIKTARGEGYLLEQ